VIITQAALAEWENHRMHKSSINAISSFTLAAVDVTSNYTPAPDFYAEIFVRRQLRSVCDSLMICVLTKLWEAR
jgi:hypothetical protein